MQLSFVKTISPCGKYSYKKLNFVVSNYLRHFHENMNVMFQGIYFICAYIDNLLLSRTDGWENHLYDDLFQPKTSTFSTRALI